MTHSSGSLSHCWLRAVAVVIASRCTNEQQREYDAELYKARHVIENFFAKLKQHRAKSHARRQGRQATSREPSTWLLP